MPASLTDREFWKVITDFSEPDGFFRSDNLLSNEMGYQQVIPELTWDDELKELNRAFHKCLKAEQRR